MEVFFYGLFMDQGILRNKGISPSNPREGYLLGYGLKIGQRASLIPSKNERAYGLVMSLKKEEVDKLYEEASVADYIPEEVHINTQLGDSITAICYNLPLEALSSANQAYANSLYTLAKQLNFPEKYLEKIKSFANSH